MKFHDMNRKQLQALCKQHGIPANRTNREMADRLASIIKDEEKLKSPLEDRVVTSMEVEGENYSNIVTKKVKKVRFSPENETFVFEKSENDSNSDEDFTPTKKQCKSKRKSNKAGLDKRSGKTTVVVRSSRIKKSISQVLELARNSSETLTSVDLGSDQTGETAEQSSEISLNVEASDFAKPVRRSKRLAPGQDTTESLAESNVVPVATENGRNLKQKQEPESNEVTSITEFVPVTKKCTRRSTRISSKDVLVVNEEQLSECSGKKQQKISNLQPTSEKSQVVESNLPQKASLSTESESCGHKITRRSSRIASNSDVDITEEQIDGKKQDISKLKPSHQQIQLSECTVALEKALNSEGEPVAVKPTRRCTRKSTCISSEVDLVVTNRQTGKCFGKKQQNMTKLQPTFEQTQLLEKTLASDKTLCVESEPSDTQPTKRFTRQSFKRDIVGTKEQTDNGFAKKQRRISKLPATIEQSQVSESMLAPKETLSTEFEPVAKPSKTSTCSTSESSLVVTDGQNGKVLRKRQVTKSKLEPLIEKPIRQSSCVASKVQKVGSQVRATEVVMPKVISQLNEDLSTEQLDQGGVDFNLLGLEKGSEAESSPRSHVQNLEIYYLDEHTTENEKFSIILDQNSELLEDAHPDGVSSLQEIQDNNELENQQIAQSTPLEKSSTNYSETESTIDATKASESIIGDESLQKSDIKNLGDEKREDSNFEETLYGEPASQFLENKDNFDTEENIEASSKFNKDSSSEHTVSKHEENGDEEDYICATPSKPQLVVNFYAGDNPADMDSPFEKDKDSSIGRSVDLPINHKGFDVSIERNISGVKEQVGDHRDLLCCLDSSLKKLYELKDHLSDSVSGNDQSADESFTLLTCQSNAKYEESSGMSVRMKKLYEEEASPFKEVISENSNGVDKFADESFVRSVCESSENYKRSNEMSVVIDSECAKHSGILTVEERTVESEDHNEAKRCDTGFDGAFKEAVDDHLDSALKMLYEAEDSPGDNVISNKGMHKELCIEKYDNVNDHNQSAAESLTPSMCSSNGNCDQINEMAIPAFQSPEKKIEESITGKKCHDGSQRHVTCMRQDTSKEVSATKNIARDGFSIGKSFQVVARQDDDSLFCLDSALKKLNEGEPSPSQDVIIDKSVSSDLYVDERVNGVSESAGEGVIPLICKSYGNDEENNIMITENEDHGTEIDHNYLKLGTETINDAGGNETISDELMELTSLFQEEQCHHLNGSSAKSTAINLSELSAVEVNEWKGVNVMHVSDFLSPSQHICCSESKSLADDNIVNSGKPIDFGNVDGFSPLKIGMGVCSADENLTYEEEDTVRENVGLSKHFKCQEDYEHQESAKEKVDQCKDANNEAVFMHGSGNKCYTLQDGEAMHCDSSLEVRPTCVLSLLKPEMAVDCSVDNTPMDIDACEHTDNAINGFSIESNVIDVLVSKEQVNDQKDSPCFRSALKKLLEREFSPTKDVSGYSKMQGATSVEQPADVIEETHNGEINTTQLVTGEDSSSYIHSLNISYGILEESKIEREEFDATESKGKDKGDEYNLSCCVEVGNDGRGNERIEEDTGVFHKVNDRLSVARASSEGESYPNDGKPLNKLDVESLNLAGTVEIEKVNVDAALTHEIEMFDSTVEKVKVNVDVLLALQMFDSLYHEEQDTIGKTEDTFRYNDSLQHSRDFCMVNDVIDLQEAVKVQPDGIEDVSHEDSSNICSASKCLTPVTEEELGMNKLDDEVFAAAAICSASASKSLTPVTKEELGMNKLDDEVFAAAASNTHEVGLVKNSNTGLFHKVNDRLGVARASSEGESNPNDGKPLNKLGVESLNLAGTVETEKVNVDAALTHEIEMFDSTVEIDPTYENSLFHEEQDTIGKTEDAFRYNDSLQHSRGFCMVNDVIDLQEAVKVQPDGIEDVAHEDSSNICSASKSLTPGTEEELGMDKFDDEVFAAAASNTQEVGLVKNSNAEAVSSSVVSKEKEDFHYLVKSHLFTSREMSLFLGDAEQIEGFNTNAVVQESSMKDDVEEIIENTIYLEHGVERSLCEQNKQMEMNFEEMEASHFSAQDKVIHETGDVLKEQNGINSENGSLQVSVDKIILAENANGSDNDPSNVMQGCDSKDVGKDSISGSNIDNPEFMVKSKNVEDDSEPSNSMLSNDQIGTGGIVSANIDELESTVEKKVSEPAEETVEFSYDQKEPDTRMVHHSSAVNSAIEKEVAVEEPLRPFVQNKTPEAKKSKSIMFSKQFSSSTMKLETNKTNLVQGTDMKENAAISKSEQLGYVTAPRANRRPLEELRKS